MRTLIDVLRARLADVREWGGHASWLALALALLGVATVLTPEDSLYSTTIDPVRLLWKLTMVLTAAWLAYQLARLVLPHNLRLDILLARTELRKEDSPIMLQLTALICAVVIGRLLFMGLVALSVASGV